MTERHYKVLRDQDLLKTKINNEDQILTSHQLLGGGIASSKPHDPDEHIAPNTYDKNKINWWKTDKNKPNEWDTDKNEFNGWFTDLSGKKFKEGSGTDDRGRPYSTVSYIGEYDIPYIEIYFEKINKKPFKTEWQLDKYKRVYRESWYKDKLGPYCNVWYADYNGQRYTKEDYNSKRDDPLHGAKLKNILDNYYVNVVDSAEKDFIKYSERVLFIDLDIPNKSVPYLFR